MKLSFINVIFSTAISGYFQKIVQFTISLVTLPLIISSLGKIEYGIYVLIGQSVALLALSDIGVTNSIGRFISKYIGNNNKSKLNDVFNTSLKILLIISLIILSITFLLSNKIPVWLNIPSEYFLISKLLFIINGIFLAITFPARIGQGILAGKQLYPIINLISAFLSILQLLGVIILFNLNKLGLIELTFLVLSVNLLNQFIIIFFAVKYSDFLKLKKYYFSNEIAKDILSLGSSSFLISLSGILMTQGLIISVGIIYGTELAGIFGVVMLIITNISFILTKISQPMVTISSELISSGNKNKLFSLIIFVMRISFAISFFITISSFYFIDFFLKLLLENSWNEGDFIVVTNSIIIILSAITIGIPQFVSRAVLQGSGYHWEATAGKVIATIISFSIGLYLMINDFGIIGASIAIALVWFLQGIFYFPFKISKFMGISLFDQIKKVYLPVIIFSIIIFFIPFLYNKVLDINNLIGLIFCEFLMLASLFILMNFYHKIFDNKYFIKIFKSK